MQELSGATLIAHGDDPVRIVIDAVQPGSPAEAAGLMAAAVSLATSGTSIGTNSTPAAIV